MNRNNARRTASLAVVCSVLAGLAAWSQTGWSQTALDIDVLSSQPEFVTGGDALVRISSTEAPKVMVGSADVSGAFRSDQKHGWVGLIEGLKNGSNLLSVKADGKEATLALINHPVNGTLFAGPQQEPFVCENVCALRGLFRYCGWREEHSCGDVKPWRASSTVHWDRQAADLARKVGDIAHLGHDNRGPVCSVQILLLNPLLATAPICVPIPSLAVYLQRSGPLETHG